MRTNIIDTKDAVLYRYGNIVAAYAPMTKKSFYYFKSNELDRIKDYLHKEKISRHIGSKSNNIKSIFIFLTNRCNFSCKYCFVTKGNTTLSQEAITPLLQLLESLPIDDRCRIFCFGGEPLLYPELLQSLISKIKTSEKLAKCGITICTNGSICNANLLKFLKKYDIYLSISLDGDSELTSLRINNLGYETFSTVAANIRTFKKEGISFAISCTVNEKNIEYLPQIPLFFKKTFGIKAMGFCLPIGYWLDADFYSYQVCKAFEVCSKIGLYEDFIVKRLYPFLAGKEFLKECNGYGNQIVIWPNFKVSTCVAIPGEIDGRDIASVKNLVSSWSQRVPPRMSSCRRCVFKYICGGGCAYNALLKKKTIFSKDKEFCKFVSNFTKYFIKRKVNKKIKVVIMDYDGTIVVRDVEGALKSAAKILSKDYHKAYTLFEQKISGFFSPKKVITLVGRELRVPKNKIDLAIATYFKIFDKGTVLPEMRKLIKRVRKKYPRLVILSVNDKQFLINQLKKFGLAKFFEEVYCVKAEEKNSGKAYLNVLAAENIQPYEALYLGDEFKREIKVVENLGMKTILVNLKGGIHPTEWIEKII